MHQQIGKICTTCVMDESDPSIEFDQDGVCEYCNNFENTIRPSWQPNQNGINAIMPLIDKIKKDGRNKEHDCLIGISGGLDSSYTAYVAKEHFGLNPLLFHCDTGWNSDISTSNIEKLVDGLGLDLVTKVIDWEQMKDLQRAFFKSQVPFVDQPQDLVLFSSLYDFANEYNFKYVITGGNHSTECFRECIDWTYFATDTKFVRNIHSLFGEGSIDQLPMCDIFLYKFYFRFIKGIRVIKILDNYPFFKEKAIDDLKDKFGWIEYPMKHYESRFTRFFESYWTPRKHSYDKRRAYFSSLIVTGQMDREDAIEKLKTPQLSEAEMRNDFEYVAKKLDWTKEEFLEIFHQENKSFKDYKNNFFFIKIATALANLFGIEKRRFK